MLKIHAHTHIFKHTYFVFIYEDSNSEPSLLDTSLVSLPFEPFRHLCIDDCLPLGAQRLVQAVELDFVEQSIPPPDPIYKYSSSDENTAEPNFTKLR